MSGSSSMAAYMWASRWLTATKGTSHTSANAFAALTPTSSAPTRPGPTVAPTASTWSSLMPASTSARATTGVSSSTWARLAISGTTPPKRACSSTWLLTTDDSTSRASTTTDAAVSSHEVSMPRMVVNWLLRSFVVEDRTAADRRFDPSEALRMLVRADLVHPHDDRV